jgi:hypothetical protein
VAIEQNRKYLLNTLIGGLDRSGSFNKGGLDKSSPYKNCGFDKSSPCIKNRFYLLLFVIDNTFLL